MKKNILIIFLVSVLAVLVMLLLRDRKHAKLWRQDQEEIRLAQIEMKKNPYWRELEKWLENRRKGHEINNKADIVVEDYLNGDMEDF